MPPEGIKGRSRVGIQQRVAQTRLADVTQGQVLSFVANVTETGFPVPRLKIITKLAHLTLQSNIEQVIPVSELRVSDAGVVNTRNRTPVVIGTGTPLIVTVASLTVNGLNAFTIGTLIPAGLNATLVPAFLKGSGVNGQLPEMHRRTTVQS